MPLKATDPNAKILILLVLWDIGAAQQEVNKGLLTKRIVPKGGKVGDFQEVFEQLQAEDLMQVSAKKIFLPAKGMEYLNARLNDPEFLFKNQIGAQTANSLLKWIREMGTLNHGESSAVAPTQSAAGAIPSYDEFKTEILALFEKLDKGYNYSGLVPIWHLRREIGERVSREEFNDWMMQMQREQFLDLQTGEAPGNTNDQKRDSITSEIRGLLFFASKPS
ncbi:hypothetical protein IQ264_24985 [Phormidium sp. LEGE 05292]|uniref:hypothetical protein n=1 Tax=[Phormidium] sp. LEGE 05292 TaxID=767427 RepID=UPI0018823C3E|nr:hypothetical protein [Phormidium sp. LEGE 05292]MBE9228670.1 hypothetical protein [Phormidium sp. LEGE 05292]